MRNLKNTDKEKQTILEETKKTKLMLPQIHPILRVLVYFITVITAAGSLIQATMNLFSEIIALMIYVIAAVSLTVSCFYIIGDMKHLSQNIIKPSIAANSFTNRVTTDYRYRTILLSLPGFGLNVIFALFNGVIGIVSSSAWHGSMAAYFLIIGLMRSAVIQYVKEKPTNTMNRELKVYKRCGYLFIFMSVALGGAVILMVFEGNGKDYPGLFIYAAAAYTFWKITLSVINLIKARKSKSPLLMTIRNIGLMDSLVSLLSLQTAMFAQFGEETLFISAMNAATGCVVCFLVIAMGIIMICNTQKLKKILSDENEAVLEVSI